jgi:transcription-repair coupling factor (superfamily II helicase)
VLDRVEYFIEVASMVEESVPIARFGFDHGLLPAKELEDAMFNFLERNIDVLVCTKIVESGLDVANANTIFINRADRFGLAELYQLRGRVGRSNRAAYAYLIVPPLHILTRTALQRLQALQEFTELGSGFKLAMRDMEIRGAGNLLGAEQSGFIHAIGFELYMKILDEAVQELKESEFKDLFKEGQPTLFQKRNVPALIEADVDAFLPEYYIENGAERFNIYHRLYDATSENEVNNIREELHDRFGKLPEEAENLLLVAALRIYGTQLGFAQITIDGKEIFCKISGENEDILKEIPNYVSGLEEATRDKSVTYHFGGSGKDVVIVLNARKGSPLQGGVECFRKLSEQVEKGAVSVAVAQDA